MGMVEFLRVDRNYQKLVNLCIGGLAVCAIAATYFPPLAWPSEILTVALAATAAFAYFVTVVWKQDTKGPNSLASIDPKDNHVVLHQGSSGHRSSDERSSATDVFLSYHVADFEKHNYDWLLEYLEHKVRPPVLRDWSEVERRELKALHKTLLYKSYKSQMRPRPIRSLLMERIIIHNLDNLASTTHEEFYDAHLLLLLMRAANKPNVMTGNLNRIPILDLESDQKNKAQDSKE